MRVWQQTISFLWRRIVKMWNQFAIYIYCSSIFYYFSSDTVRYIAINWTDWKDISCAGAQLWRVSYLVQFWLASLSYGAQLWRVSHLVQLCWQVSSMVPSYEVLLTWSSSAWRVSARVPSYEGFLTWSSSGWWDSLSSMAPPAIKGFLPGPCSSGWRVSSTVWCPAKQGFSPGPAQGGGSRLCSTEWRPRSEKPDETVQ